MIIGPLRGLSVRRMFRICDGVELQLSNERANCMSENNDAKHVLLVLISHSDLGGVRPTGFYVDEAAHPWQVFRRMGFTVGLASIAGGVPSQAGRHPGDPVQEQFLHDADISRQLVNTRALAQVNANRYDSGAIRWRSRCDVGFPQQFCGERRRPEHLGARRHCAMGLRHWWI